MDDDLRYVTRFGGTASIRTLRRILRGVAVMFAVFAVLAVTTGNDEPIALALLSVGGMLLCLLLAAFPGLLAPRSPDGTRLPLRGK